MARFCFNAINKGVLEILKDYYTRVDVSFELEPTDDESFDGCVILKNHRDKDIFLNLTNNLPSIEGLLNSPTYSPHWKKIRHAGPHMLPDPPFLGAHLSSKTGILYNLTPVEEKYARLFIPHISSSDDVFRHNFWKDFKEILKRDQPFQSLDEIIWTDLQKKMSRDKLIQSHGNKHNSVEIDDKLYSVTPFAVDNASIFLGNDETDERRGMIKKAIDPKDITVNISPEYQNTVSRFKTVYAPSVSWAAKWRHPITKDLRFMNIIFEAPDDIIEHFSDDEDDSEREGVDYGSSDEDDSEDDSDGEEGEDGNEEDEGVRGRGRGRGRGGRAGEGAIEADEEDIPDYWNLDKSESLLPMSYVISGYEQWYYILNACKSNFNVVKNLGKVNNAVLKLVADAAGLANTKDVTGVLKLTPQQIQTNNTWIRYARQRGV